MDVKRKIKKEINVAKFWWSLLKKEQRKRSVQNEGGVLVVL